MPATMPFRFCTGLLVALLLPGAATADPAAPDPAKVQRMLKLLGGVSSEYREAFDDRGAVVRPIDLEETGLLLGEVRELSTPLRATDPRLENLLTGLTSLVAIRVPPDVVAAYAEVARRYL